MMSLTTMEISPKMLKIGNKLTRAAAILDLRKVNFGYFQAHMTLRHQAKNEYDVINNNGDITQNVENRQ